MAANNLNFFGSLSRLAGKVDKETQNVKDRMSQPRHSEAPEAAILLLGNMHKELKTLYVSRLTVLHLVSK